MTLYIWKIIELPCLSLNDLIYKISFELFLFSPEEAKEFIDKVVHKGYLIVGANNKLNLSDALALELNNWHKERRVEILENINNSTNIAHFTDNFKKNDSNKFNVLLKAFLDKGAINRAVLVLDSAIIIDRFDPHGKIVKAEVKGSREIPYTIEISINEKVLKHDCHDFQTKRAPNKKFCKHIAKLFLVLKEKDEKGAFLFLENITKDINKWDFVT